jgi:hypothetical protein
MTEDLSVVLALGLISHETARAGYAGGSAPSATNRNFSEFFISPRETIAAFPFFRVALHEE